MQNDYTDKIVLITGGTSGIGKVTPIAFAQSGAMVVANLYPPALDQPFPLTASPTASLR